MKLLNRIFLLIFSLINFIYIVFLSKGILEFDLYNHILFFIIFIIIWILVNFILLKFKKKNPTKP